MSLPSLVVSLAARRKLTLNHAQQQHHVAGAVGLTAQFGSGAAVQPAPGAVDASDGERQKAPLVCGQPRSQVGSIAALF